MVVHVSYGIVCRHVILCLWVVGPSAVEKWPTCRRQRQTTGYRSPLDISSFERRLALKTIKIQSHSEKATNAHRFRHKKYIITQRGPVDAGRLRAQALIISVCWQPGPGLGPGHQTALGPPLYYFRHKFVFWPRPATAPLVFFGFFGCRILKHLSCSSTFFCFCTYYASGTSASFCPDLSNLLWWIFDNTGNHANLIRFCCNFFPSSSRHLLFRSCN